MDILRWDGKLAKQHGLPVYKKINSESGAEHRYFIRLKTGKLVSYARFLWNQAFPEDQVRNGEEIHHKDFNAMNNDINNLEKLTSARHKAIHAKGPIRDNVISFNLAVALREAIESRKIPPQPTSFKEDWPEKLANVG